MKSKNLRLFFAHDALFKFSDTMMVLILPLFIYNTFHSISLVFFFTLTWNLIYMVTFLSIFNWGMRHKNPKINMVLGILFYLVAQGIFSQVKSADDALLFGIGTLFFACYICFYWMTRHWFFSVNTNHKKIGKHVSYLAILNIGIGFTAPIVAGTLSFFQSFSSTFFVGITASILSLIPILFFYAPPHPEHYSWKKVKTVLKKPTLYKMRWAYIGEGLANSMTMWPWVLAFFLFVGNVKDLGILIGITTLITAIAVRLTGHFFDRKKRTVLLEQWTFTRIVGVLLYASVGLYNPMAYVWSVDLFNRFAGSVHNAVVDSYLFGYSNKMHPVEFHLNREVNLNIARIIANTTLGITFLWLPNLALWWIIGLSALTYLGWFSLKSGDHLLH